MEEQTSTVTDLLANLEYLKNQNLAWQQVEGESRKVIEQKTNELESLQKTIEDKNKELATFSQQLEDATNKHRQEVEDKNSENCDSCAKH